MATLLITGDRDWTDAGLIDSVFAHQVPATIDLVVHGCARGADFMAGKAAVARGIQVATEPAQWDRYGNSAGPTRNRLMADKYKPSLCFAFHDDLQASKGTKHMVAYCRERGIPVKLFSHQHPEGQDL